MTLDELCARRVAVWGTGTEGLALVELLAERGVVPTCIDDHPVEAAGRLAAAATGGTPVPVTAPGRVDWSTLEVVVRSPGVVRTRSELVAAEAAGVAVTTAMAVWLEDAAGGPVLAVTGTKGKSTTAALAASILRRDGVATELLGNIGVPVTEAYRRPDAEAYVVEVSSYQAVDVTRSPGVVVLTSLAPDHLDWHGGVEPYYRDKLRLVEAGPPGRLAVCAASPEALERTSGHPARTCYGPAGRCRVADDGWVEVDGARLVDTARLRIPGRHNIWNLCGAITGIVLLTGQAPTAAAVGAAVDGFTGLPSRCHVLGEREGRTYVDDALASNPFAAAASIETFAGRALTVIVGGADRGVDPEPMVAALLAHRPRAAVVVLAPGTGRLSERLGPEVAQVVEAGDLGQAVSAAAGLTVEGGVVLFSPGAPTPEGDGGYRARSRDFAEAAGLGEA